MWDLNKGKIAQSTGLSLHFCENKKFLSNDGSSRNSRRLKQGRVVDTPRRARASIGKGVDDNVALFYEILDTIGLGAAHLPPKNNFDSLVSLL